jgi:hypothetical protein
VPERTVGVCTVEHFGAGQPDLQIVLTRLRLVVNAAANACGHM